MIDHVLMVVENMSVPRDRRVWQQALALRGAGYAVSVISPRTDAGQSHFERLDGVDIHRHDLTPSGGGAIGYMREYAQALRAERRLARRIFEQRPFQVMHLCNPPDLLFLVALPFRAKHGTAIVFDHHDLAPELFEAKYGRRGLLHGALLAAERRSLRSADVVIVPNESYREIAVGRGGVSNDRIFVVRGAPDLSRFEVRGTSDHRRGRKHLIGYVGVLGEQDGVDILLRAVRRLKDDRFGSSVHLTIIGDGPEAPALHQEAERLGIADQVEFTGWLSGDELTERLAASDVCACPDPVNAFNERSTMIKVMEYMALGLPIVQFDTREGRYSAGDAASHAIPGDEEDFARRLGDLLESPAIAARMGAAGRERVERALSWSHQVPHLLAAYERAAAVFAERRSRTGAGVEA